MNTIPFRSENPTGLYKKYYIAKRTPHMQGADTIDPVDEDAEYFVLRLDDGGKDPNHVAACRKAVLTYAENIKDYIPKLAADLIERYGK